MSGGFKAFLWFLAALIILPAVLWVGLFVVVIGGAAIDEYRHSGSARGTAALDRARNALHGLGGNRWHAVATDAWAGWGAPDMNGDQIENYAFTLPAGEVPAFLAALEAQWTAEPIERAQPDDPRVCYIFGGARLVLNRQTGRVQINWGNYYDLTPATKPAGRAAGQRPTSGPKTAITYD